MYQINIFLADILNTKIISIIDRFINMNDFIDFTGNQKKYLSLRVIKEIINRELIFLYLVVHAYRSATLTGKAKSHSHVFHLFILFTVTLEGFFFFRKDFFLGKVNCILESDEKSPFIGYNKYLHLCL